MLTGIKSQVWGCIIRDQQDREAWRGHQGPRWAVKPAGR